MTSSIILGPFQAVEVKDNCISLAQSMNYTYVGIIGEYCVSVHTFQDHPEGEMQDKCEDGIGRYDPLSATQYMDVYMITSTSKQELSNGDDVKSVPQGVSGTQPSMMAYPILHITAILMAVMMSIL